MSKTIVLAALLVAVLVAVVLAAPAPKRKGPRGPSKHAGHHRRPRSPVAYYADNFYGEDYNDYDPLALDYKNFPDLQNEYYDAMYNYYYPYAEPRPIYGYRGYDRPARLFAPRAEYRDVDYFDDDYKKRVKKDQANASVNEKQLDSAAAAKKSH